MDITLINSPDAPVAAGGYSQAVQVEGAKRLLFISGQIPVSAQGVVPTNFREQAQQAWANVIAQLQAAGLTVQHLVKVTIFLASREHAMLNREVRQEALGAHAPALTVIITGIFDEQWLLEIEAIAAA